MISFLAAFSLVAIASVQASPTNIEVNETGWWWEGQPGTFNASDTPIQHAIDNATDGDTIFVHAGNYTPSSTININKNNLTLYGPQANVDPRPSQGSTRTPGSAAEAIINGSVHGLWRIIYIDADNVTINGLEVKSGTGDLIRQSDAYYGTTVKYCIVHNATGDELIQLKKCSHGLIEYCLGYDGVQDGFNLAEGSDNGTIRNCEAYNIESINGVIYVYNSENMRITGNYIHECTAANGIRIYNMNDYSVLQIDNNTIENNTFNRSAKPGGRYAQDGNAIQLYKEYHKATANDFTIVIENNIINNNNGTGKSGAHHGHGIYWYPGPHDCATNITVRYNNITNNHGWGVKMEFDVGYEHQVENISINCNNIVGNHKGGVDNNIDPDANATCNWWGDKSGPGPVGPGSGDNVSANVNYDPWLAMEFQYCPECGGAQPKPNITSFAPPSPVNDTVCNWRTFNVTVNQTVNVSWYLNAVLLHTNQSITEANCTLHAKFVGDNNVSAVASNANGTNMQTWIWSVSSAPVPVPEFNAIGLLAFIGISSVVLAVATLRKRK